MIANVVTLIAGGLTLIPNLTTLCIGRFLYGAAAGGYSVFCPKYISEIAPTAIKGPAGCLTQICVTFGILVANALGLIPFDADGESSMSDDNKDKCKLIVYITFIAPIAFSVI